MGPPYILDVQYLHMNNPSQALSRDATISLNADARAQFIARTYTHLLGAICAFVLIEWLLFASGIAAQIAGVLAQNWIFALGGFMIVSWIASSMAQRVRSLPGQYLALGLFVVAEAIIFTPLLWIANSYAPGTIESAAIITILAFTGLTAIVFVTKKDFSFLGAFLKYAFLLALVAIIGGLIFGFQLGLWFSIAMVALAGGAILHDTSNVLRRFPVDCHVVAAMQLFASVALLFWYVLQILMSLGSSD